LVRSPQVEYRFESSFGGRETCVASASNYDNNPIAAGRPTGPNQNQVTAQTAQPTHGANDHPPPAPGGGGPNLFFMLMLFLPLFFLLFWMPRSQQKKQAAALAKLQKGDRVITQSGLIGKLVELGERTFKLEIAPGVKIDVLKSSIAGKDGADAPAPADKK
jgi:preprotein translocase subunit YajC